MQNVFLLTGSNSGNSHSNLMLALDTLSLHVGFINAVSPVYVTEPWGFKADTNFLNQAIKIETELSPEALLRFIHNTEQSMGRKRSGSGYESRVIDIDILFYGNKVIQTDDLVIPHPLLHKRRFALNPLFDLAPDFEHPVFLKPISQLLTECTDTSMVKIYSS